MEKVVKGGLIAVVNGVNVFIPSSQVSNRFIEDLSVFNGQKLEFNIIEVDRVKRRFIGGRKALVEQEIAAKRAALFETIQAGSKVTGYIKKNGTISKTKWKLMQSKKQSATSEISVQK